MTCYNAHHAFRVVFCVSSPIQPCTVDPFRSTRPGSLAPVPLAEQPPGAGSGFFTVRRAFWSEPAPLRSPSPQPLPTFFESKNRIHRAMAGQVSLPPQLVFGGQELFFELLIDPIVQGQTIQL